MKSILWYQGESIGNSDIIYVDGILQEDVVCNSPSTAGWIAMGQSNNGWAIWKDEDEQPIDIYRKG